MTLSIILIDNHREYRWCLGSWLKQYLILGRVSHSEFIQSKMDLLADVALIAFDDNLAETLETIHVINQKFPLVKIIVNSTVYDEEIVGELKKKPIHGLVFDALKNHEELNMAIIKVYNGETYFHL